MQAELHANRILRLPRAALLGAGLIGLLGAATCGPLPDNDGERGQATDLSMNETILNTLDCGGGDCRDWYRVRLGERGTLYIEGRTIRREEANPQITILLEDGFGDGLESLQVAGDRMHSRVIENLDSGVYLLGMESAAETEAIAYELRMRFEPATVVRVEPTVSMGEVPTDDTPVTIVRPPIAPPTIVRVPVEVLEVEGGMAEPTAVLLDLGRNRGLYPGLRGELREGDRVVGEIEIVDIYDEGSRARVELPLRRPITPSVTAVLLFPQQNQVEAPEETLQEDPEFPSTRDEASEMPTDRWSTEADAIQPYAD